ncbi:MAG: RNA polymerase sigma factor (sigma-70 family) [Planctomycetota bacterium]|jgi:RNA polymerase sigma factor (sigma-70 family)
MMPSPDRSDNELMLRVQAGDLEAFEHLVERFKIMVHGLAISMLRRTEDAEEATQDTFLKLFRARDSFDNERKLGPWLLRIAGNACRDRLRRRRVVELPTVRLDGEDRDVLSELPDLRIGHGAADEHVAPTVRTELDRLSEKVRAPLELKYMRGQTNLEIAAALGISVSNVKVQLARGKDILASRLESIGATWGRAGKTAARGASQFSNGLLRDDNNLGEAEGQA